MNIKIPKILFFFFSLASLFYSCSGTPKFIYEDLANTKFDESLAEKELSRKGSDKVYPFTLNYKNNYGCPVIYFRMDGRVFTFSVDTGSEQSFIFNKGIAKLFGSVADFEDKNLDVYLDYTRKTNPDKLENKSEEQHKKMFHQDLADLELILTYHQQFAEFIYLPKDPAVDGIIGQDIMKKFARVTFDFTDNLIILDGERIEGSVLPMIESEMETVFIEFSYDGKKEYGLVDTGNYTFTPRSNFGKDEVHFDFRKSADFSAAYKGPLKKRFPWILTFNNIKIGGIEYNDIKGAYSNIWFSTYNKGAQNMLRLVSGLGCEFFRGHIIQFDYENNDLIIR